ncbi:plastid transcriptionally active 16 [Forsythia ovata]|uniref:Plastid transcriptionally active 16 n=1 Tax=Forsythia ovata TaxID=205694 RepID=A0ABD1RKN3_9LAMI
MALTLTSNSFLLITTPHSRLALKSRRLTVFSKKGGSFQPFRQGKTADPSEESQEGSLGNSNPFRFDFGNLPDVKSLVPAVINPSSGLSLGSQRRKDPGTVFVAGATGLVGIRIAQTLLRDGFSVRAGVSDLGTAQELALLASKYKIISNSESKRLNAVESTYQDAESIAKAIGNASKVVVTIGPAENGPGAGVSTTDALQVIQAAQLANVGHVAIVYDESSIVASTYNVLDGISSFFNNLFSGSQPLTMAEFLQKLIETDVTYTLIKTKLTEDFSPESSYNIVVSAEGSADANDYKVAKSRIATLVADVFSNTAVAENKVVKVFTDPSAPSRTIDELFGAIPEDGRRKSYAEALAKARAEEEAIKASERARSAAKAAKKLEEEVKKLEAQEATAANLSDEAQKKAEAAGASVESLLDKAKGISSGISWEKLSSQLKSAVQKSSEESKVQIATIRGQAKAWSLPSQKAVVKKPSPKPSLWKQKEVPKPKAKESESKTEVRKVFGGLFKQEIIYVDDD